MPNMKPPAASGGDDGMPPPPPGKLILSGSATPSSSSSSATQTPSHQTSHHGNGRLNPATLATSNGCSFPNANGNGTNGNSPGCFIKPSLSLNSLPPQAPADGSEMAQNRLRIDRPYNSLKKKRDSERELWRRSWGSGHSHSSCSLQSSTTTGGIGKDDFWAALQTNYNFIMDTNLLDSCREARGELGDGDGPVMRAEEDDVDYYRKAMYKPSPMQTFYGDPRLLRQWIKEMETRIARIPSVTETKKLNIEQLLKLSGEHSEIYREIVSNSRAVAACVRAYEKKSAKANSKYSQSVSNISGVTSVTSSTSTGTTSSSGNSGSTATAGGGGSCGEPSGSGSLTPEVDQGASSGSYYLQQPRGKSPPDASTPTALKLGSSGGKSKENSIVKGLERRYHLLYLKAIEIQCLLEGLLDNKTSSSDNNASLSDTDEEPVNKLARLSSCNKNKSPGSLPNDECLSSEEWVKAKKFSSAGFDADSEGSDCEIVPNIISYHHHQQQHNLLSPTATTTTTTSNTTPNSPSTPPPSTHPENEDDATLMLLPPEGAATVATNSMMETDVLNLSTTTTGTATTTTSSTSTTVAKLSGADIIDGIIREAAQDLINNNSQTTTTTTSDENSNPTQQHQPILLLGKTSSPKAKGGQSGGGAGGKQKRSKANDLSKFNRSTRKSKNCATFYFKHLDTDSELNKDSSERTKSEESSSSSEGDEGWVYNNGDGGVQEGGDDVSQDSTGSDKPMGDEEEDEKENKPGGEKGKEDGKQTVAIGNGKDGGGVKSKKCLDFSAEALAGVNLSSRALMMTSIGSFGKSSDSVDSGAGKGKYATSSIHRLVLNAESLVRDEIFAKTAAATPHKTAASKNHPHPHQYLHHHHHHHHHHHRGGGSNNVSNSNNNSANNCNGGSSNRKTEKAMSNHKINRIEEWLEKQPLDVAATAPLLPGSGPTTDCEASGEYTDSDSITRDTDSSEGLANSVATCLQGDQTSQEMLLASTDNVYPSETSNVSNDEVESSKNRDSATTSNPSLVKRRVRDKPSGERPWSVSCISQLNTSAVEINQYGARCHHESSSSSHHQNQRLTAHNFSISESALNNMSAVRGTMKTSTSAGGGSQQPLVVKSSDSKGSLKKRKMRARRKNRIDESGSDESQPPTHQSSALHLLQHSIILQHQQQLLQQQQQQHHHLQHQPLREIQLSTGGGGGSSSGSGRQYRRSAQAAAAERSQGLLKSESFSGRIRLADDLVTLSSLSGSSGSRKSSSARQTTRGTALTTMMANSLSALAAASVAKSSSKSSAADSEEEQHHNNPSSVGASSSAMAKPNFKIGSSVTRTRCGGSLNLGSLAALANYNLDNNGTGVAAAAAAAGMMTGRRSEPDLNGTGTGTEEMSSFSEQAWDNYQEKYMSEPYSEDRDTDAARRLLDFGDDYRNFIDSQSDCASSSLSAANMDSLSPPRFRKHGADGSGLLVAGGGGGGKGSDPNVASSLNQRRKRLDEYRMDDRYSHNMHSWSSKSGSPPHHHHLLDKTLTLSSRSSKHHAVLYESPDQSPLASPGGPGNGGGGPLVLSGSARRRSLRSVDKHNTFLRSLSHETSSSSNNEFDEDMEAEVKKLLIQSKMRFANTEALKTKSHLLKPEDYDEIIKTCRENVRCLETVLLSQPGTVLTAAKCQDLRGKQEQTRAHHPKKKTKKKPPPSPLTHLSSLRRRPRKNYRYDNDDDDDGRSRPPRHSDDDDDDDKTSDSDNDSDDDSGVRVEKRAAGGHLQCKQPHRKVVVVRRECRCARITRFIASVIDFLLDVGNLLRNFRLYRFFVGVLNGLYRLVGFLGWSWSGRRPPVAGGGGGGAGDDDGSATLRKLTVGVV